MQIVTCSEKDHPIQSTRKFWIAITAETLVEQPLVCICDDCLFDNLQMPIEEFRQETSLEEYDIQIFVGKRRVSTASYLHRSNITIGSYAFTIPRYLGRLRLPNTYNSLVSSHLNPGDPLTN